MFVRTDRNTPFFLIAIVALSWAAASPQVASAQARKDPGFDMGPPTPPELAAAAAAAPTPVAPGLFRPTWESIREHYKVPTWFVDGKFGLFLHWGVYAVPGY